MREWGQVPRDGTWELAQGLTPTDQLDNIHEAELRIESCTAAVDPRHTQTHCIEVLDTLTYTSHGVS